MTSPHSSSRRFARAAVVVVVSNLVSFMVGAVAANTLNFATPFPMHQAVWGCKSPACQPGQPSTINQENRQTCIENGRSTNPVQMIQHPSVVDISEKYGDTDKNPFVVVVSLSVRSQILGTLISFISLVIQS